MAGCEQFALGSRQRQICDGDSELPLKKVNAFRAMYGVDPLPARAVTSELVASGKVVSRIAANVRTPKVVASCCGSKKPAPTPPKRMVEGTGVGGRLIEMFKKHGFEACEACYALAHRMNEWGVDGCWEHIDEIVADILPRAIEWEFAKVGWWMRLMPHAVTEALIKGMVIRAIETSVPLEFETPVEVLPEIIPVHKPKRLPASKYTQRNEARQSPTGPPVEFVNLEDAVRHLTFHVYPVADYGAWQWNCDRLLKNSGLFNGRRIIAVATDQTTDSVSDVKRYLADFADEFVEVPNNSVLREGVTWLPMLEKLQSLDSQFDVTFSCHAKGVRHRIEPEDHPTGSTIFPWTQAMWDTCSNWGIVRPLLESHATVGSFRRIGGHPNTINSFGEWHYSGTFYWWRNRDAFRRKWKEFPKTFFGTEAWPGILFAKHEAGVVFGENVQDLYNFNYWTTEIEPKLKEWREQHAS